MRTVHERLKLRRQKVQPTTAVSVNMPDDVVEDLREIATLRGYSSLEALLRSYIGHMMRVDLEHFYQSEAHVSGSESAAHDKQVPSVVEVHA